MISYRADTIRQKPPAPKAPEPEPVKKRHQGGYRMSAERLASMEEKKAMLKAMWGQSIEEIQIATGYKAKSTIHKIARELGLPHKGRGGRR